ncbi:MAG: hypothetical protein IT158_27765 [Bryobacterales bacterium]|nr:hypothetical protein [Bryobacterales bacterium]
MTRAGDWLGKTVERRVAVTPELIDRFVALSGDSSSIHVDDGFARERGFRTRIAHGLLIGSLLSALVGTELPGHAGVLQQASFSFRNPCYPGDCLHLRLEVHEFIESVQTLILKAVVRNQDGLLIATAKIQTGITSIHG